MRIVIDTPVAGVAYCLQAKDGSPLAAQRSRGGEPLAFDFAVRARLQAGVARLTGDQVRREGPTRRFVYIRIGALAGDPASPWSRRMKIDVHNIDPAMLARAAQAGGVIETTVIGADAKGEPACATQHPIGRRLITD